jgi:uncharacterized membrane protein (UPF0127 family)
VRKTFLWSLCFFFLGFIGIAPGLAMGQKHKTRACFSQTMCLDCNKPECINVEVVRSKEELARGLSGRESLAPDHGMLFVFDQPGLYRFWMKAMRFPLDIIWLDQHRHVINVSRNQSPCTTSACPKVSPAGPAQYVLEVPAGFFDAHGLNELNTRCDFLLD